MGFLQSLFGNKNMNADPDQQALTQLFIDAVQDESRIGEIVDFLVDHGWSRTDAGNRVVHALSVVKISRPDLYPRAKTIGEAIYVSL